MHSCPFMILESLHISIIWQHIVETKFYINYNKNVSFKKRHKVFKADVGEKKNLAICMGFYVAIYSIPWQTYLPGQPLHHTVHVCTIQSKHLLKETHSPTYTVNFASITRGKTCFTVQQIFCQFFQKAFWNDLLLWVTYSIKVKILQVGLIWPVLTIVWLNYTRRTHWFFLSKFSLKSKI